MRLKQGNRNQPVSPDELQGLLKNQRVNRQYEETNVWTRSTNTNITSTRPAVLSNVKRPQPVWTGTPLFRSLRSPPSTTNIPILKTTTLTSNNPLPYAENQNNLESPCYDDTSLASPLGDDCDQAMSMSSPEESPSQANGTSEEDSLSDLEYNESSPLLCPDELSSDEERDATERSTEDNLNINNKQNEHPLTNVIPGGQRHRRQREGSTGQNDVESEDSMFSDSSCDLSDSKESSSSSRGMESGVFQHRQNNNNPQVTTVINSQSINRNYYRGTSRVDQVFTETVQPLLHPVAVTCRPHLPPRNAIKTDVSEAVRVLSLEDSSTKNKSEECRTLKSPGAKIVNLKLVLDVGHSPSSSSSEAEAVSPMSDTNSASEVDINMAPIPSLNNMSLPLSKENGIQCLFKDGEEAVRSVNIVEHKFESDKTEILVVPDESKILNTSDIVEDDTIPLLTRDMLKSQAHNGEPLLTTWDQQGQMMSDISNEPSCNEYEGDGVQDDNALEDDSTEAFPIPEELITADDECLEPDSLEMEPIENEVVVEKEVPLCLRESVANLITVVLDEELVIQEDTYDIQEHNFIDQLSSEEEMELQKEPIPEEFRLLPKDDDTDNNSLSSDLSLIEDTVSENKIHIDDSDVEKNQLDEQPTIRNKTTDSGFDSPINQSRSRESASPFRSNDSPLFFEGRNEPPSKTPTKQAVVKPYRFEKEPELVLEDTDVLKQRDGGVALNDNWVKPPIPKALIEDNVLNNNNNNSVQKNCSVLNSANLEGTTRPTKVVPPKVHGHPEDHSAHRKRSLKSKRSSTTGSQQQFQQSDMNGDFDVYNIETAMPTIDWAAMEEHLTRAAKENDWLMRRRNDREEIRRKLAMDSDSEEYYCGERVARKPSLTTRLQSGMNLQICFMNETASDLDSQGSDQDSENGNPAPSNKDTPKDKRISAALEKNIEPEELKSHAVPNHAKTNGYSNRNSTSSTSSNESDSSFIPWKQYQQQQQNLQSQTPHQQKQNTEQNSKRQRPSFFFSRQKSWRLGQLKSQKKEEPNAPLAPLPVQKRAVPPEEDFLTRHARLQAEARHALSQAKEMARMQMEVERQRKKKSPIADIVGIPFPDGRHRLTRQVLTDMNVAQLQVIVNDLHSQIESLNEDLVRLLLERDDLNMEQDSMLVDIEDMTRFLGAKDEALKTPIAHKLAGIK